MLYVKKLGLWVGVVATLLGVVIPPATAHAQAATAGGSATTTRPPLSLTTSPIPLSIITQPGKTVTSDLRVKNNGTEPETLRIDLLKFGASGTNGDPKLEDRGPKDTYFDWVSFSETSFVAQPNVWKTIKMTIKTPPSAAFGYYLAVLFSRANPGKPTGGASGLEGGVASLVLLDVEAPGAKREAKVVTFTSSRKVYEFLPASFNIKLTNSGNVHVAPSGNIFIKHGGSQVATLDFNNQQGNILPGTDRVFAATWNDGFPSYVTKVVGTKTTTHLTWNFANLQKLRIGKYTATLVAVYDDGQRDIPIEGEVSFWVIPWRILGVTLLILLLVGAGLFGVFRSFWRKIHPASSKKQKKAKAGKPDKKAAKASKAAAESEVAAEEPDEVDDDDETEGEAEDAEPTPAPTAKPAAVKPTKIVSKPSQPAPQPSTAPEAPKTAPEIKD